MITLIFFLHFFGVLTMNEASIDFTTSKPIMCAYTGDKAFTTSELLPVVDPNNVPEECEIVIYMNCDPSSTYTCNVDDIKKLKSSNRIVMVYVYREYSSWLSVLTPDGNAEDAKAVTDFATANGAIGVLIEGLGTRWTEEVPDGTLATNIVPYLQQLKCNNPDFIVGMSIDSYPYILNEPCVFNYETSNSLLDFFIVNTYELNSDCDASIFNGNTPIGPVGELYSMEAVLETISQSKVPVEKTYLVIDLMVDDPDTSGFKSFTEFCLTTSNTSAWCAPPTKHYYDMAKFIRDHNYGIFVYWIELDDVQNSCGCCPFIGFQNIIAGYNGGAQIPCCKFDINESP